MYVCMFYLQNSPLPPQISNSLPLREICDCQILDCKCEFCAFVRLVEACLIHIAAGGLYAKAMMKGICLDKSHTRMAILVFIGCKKLS